MKKIAPQYTGGAVDESLTAEAERLIRLLPGDTNDIENKIRRLLGRYRDFRKFHDTEPQVSVTIDHLKGLAKQANKLKDGLKLIPDDAKAILSECMFDSWDITYFHYEQNLIQNLTRLQAALSFVAKDFEPLRGRPGAPPRSLEHSLLSDVAGLIELHSPNMLLTDAANYAADLLRASGVKNLPIEPAEARKVINSWRKRKGSE